MILGRGDWHREPPEVKTNQLVDRWTQMFYFGPCAVPHAVPAFHQEADNLGGFNVNSPD